MNKPSYEALLQMYKEAKATILELREDLDKKDDTIDLLETNISELEDILYTNRIFKHFD